MLRLTYRPAAQCVWIRQWHRGRTMKLLSYFRSPVAKFFHRAQVENDLEEELRAHIQLRADDLERSGLDRAEAERRARIEFGGREQFKEESREALGGTLIETFIR